MVKEPEYRKDLSAVKAWTAFSKEKMTKQEFNRITKSINK